MDTTTTTSLPLKTLSIRLTDIFDDLSKQLADKCRENHVLKSCLNKSDLIQKWLEKCNETLVEIFELCQLDQNMDEKFVQLIGSVRQLENRIEREKQNLRTDCRRLSTTVATTSDNVKYNTKELKKYDTNGLTDGQNKLFSSEDIDTDDVDDKDNSIQNDSSDRDVGDGKDSRNVIDISDDDDYDCSSDTEWWTSKKKNRKRLKIASKRSTDHINSTPTKSSLKIGDKYRSDTPVVAENKTPDKDYCINDNKQIDSILKLFVVDDDGGDNDSKYVCHRENCQFSCPLSDREVFYEHYKQHDNVIYDPIHTDDPNRPFGCDKCCSTFIYTYDAVRHKRNVHPQTLYVCNQSDCGIKLKSLTSFIQHKKNKHRNLKKNKKKMKTSMTTSVTTTTTVANNKVITDSELIADRLICGSKTISSANQLIAPQDSEVIAIDDKELMTRTTEDSRRRSRQENQLLMLCLNKSDAIRKYLEECNETLMEIFDLCQLDQNSDAKFVQLVGSVKELEDRIERENQSLRTLREDTDRCLSAVVQTFDEKSIQTDNNFGDNKELAIEKPVVFKPIDVKCDTKESKYDTNLWLTNGQNSCDLTSMKSIQEVTSDSDVVDVNDNNDCSETSKNRKRLKKSKLNTEQINSTTTVKSSLKTGDKYRSDTPIVAENKTPDKDYCITDNKLIDSILKVFVDNDSKYVCHRENCQFSCPIADKNVFYEHYKQHNNITFDPIPTDNRKRPFGCDECLAMFMKLPDIQRHKREVHPHSLYVCNQAECGVKLKTLRGFIQHKRNVHKNVKNKKMKTSMTTNITTTTTASNNVITDSGLVIDKICDNKTISAAAAHQVIAPLDSEVAIDDKELTTVARSRDYLLLKASLNKSDLIRKYQDECNETLVAIIELCQLDENSNTKIVELVESVKQLENRIEQEKQNLQTLREDDNNNNVDDNQLAKLIRNTTDSRDKCIQTDDIKVDVLIGKHLIKIKNEGNYCYDNKPDVKTASYHLKVDRTYDDKCIQTDDWFVEEFIQPIDYDCDNNNNNQVFEYQTNWLIDHRYNGVNQFPSIIDMNNCDDDDNGNCNNNGIENVSSYSDG